MKSEKCLTLRCLSSLTFSVTHSSCLSFPPSLPPSLGERVGAGPGDDEREGGLGEIRTGRPQAGREGGREGGKKQWL